MRKHSELFSLAGKTAVVIGGGGHICSALAHGFVGAGAKVVVADLRLEKAESVASAIESEYKTTAMAAQVDASSKNSLQQLLIDVTSKFGKVDVVVNGAGINSPKPFLEITEEDWHEVVNSQLTATMFGCQVFGKAMTQQRSGSISTISSAAADPALSKA